MRFFWILQIICFTIYVGCFTADHISCNKVYNRSSDLCLYIIFFFVFMAVYPYFCRVAEVSAHDAFLTHKSRFKCVLLVNLLILVFRILVVSSYIGYEKKMSIQ